MLGKKSSEKSVKKLFLFSHEYRGQKMVEKKARNNFSRNTRIVRAKKSGKKDRREKGRINVFYIHTNIVTQKGGGKRAKQVFQKHTISASKKCCEKDRWEKGRKKVFCIQTNIVTKKKGKKLEIQFFQKHTNSAGKNVGIKIVGK